jgi:tetratricopeptide (TPR) repeat protein
MSEAQEREPFRIDEAVGHIIARLRVPLLVLLVIVAVALIAIVVVTDRRRALLERSTVLIEEVEQRWMIASAEERASLDSEVLPQLELLAERHRGRYAGRRALHLLAARHAEREEWQEAADRFSELADLSSGYLAALALSNAAVAYEELGDRDTAASIYGDVASRFPDEVALAPRALFAVARLEEERGDPVRANDAYLDLEEKYPGSRWSLLSLNRRIYLRATGALDGN